MVKKFLRDDGTFDLQPYEEYRTDGIPYQFGTLLNENSAVKSKAIDDYRNRYLSKIDKGMKQMLESMRFPAYDATEDPCKGVNINDVKLDMRIDNYTMHRMIFLVPSATVIQKVQTTG